MDREARKFRLFLALYPFFLMVIGDYVCWDSLTNPLQKPISCAKILTTGPRRGTFYVTGCSADQPESMANSEGGMIIAVRPLGQSRKNPVCLFYVTDYYASSTEDEESGATLHGILRYLSEKEKTQLTRGKITFAPRALVLDSERQADWRIGLAMTALGAGIYVYRYWRGRKKMPGDSFS